MTIIAAFIVLLLTVTVGVAVGRRFGAAKATMVAGATLVGGMALLGLLVALVAGRMN